MRTVVRDETYECQAYLSVSVLDGDPRHANLLRFALRYLVPYLFKLKSARGRFSR
jgi:hypothetical protein